MMLFDNGFKNKTEIHRRVGEPTSNLVKKDFPPGDCSNFELTNSLTSFCC